MDDETEPNVDTSIEAEEFKDDELGNVGGG